MKLIFFYFFIFFYKWQSFVIQDTGNPATIQYNSDGVKQKLNEKAPMNYTKKN